MNKEQKKKTDLIDESVKFASAIKKSAETQALSTFANLISEDVKVSLLESDEPFPSEPNQPSGYDIDGAQKRIEGTGDSVEDEGDGPDIIEGDEPDESTATMSKEDDPITADNALDSIAEMDDLDLEMPSDDDGEEEDMNMDMKEDESLSVESDDNDKDDEVEVTKAVKKEKEVNETLRRTNKQLQATNAKLKTENTKLNKALTYINKKLQETALINNKMHYMNNIFTKYPVNVNSKKKIVEHFDKAKTNDAVKMVYETVVNILKENTKTNTKTSTATNRAKKVYESAQKNQGSLLNEGTKDNFNRFQKLAGLDG